MSWLPSQDFLDVVVNANTTHPKLSGSIAMIGTAATLIHQTVGGKTAIESLLCVYLNMALEQCGIEEVTAVLTRALEGLPDLDKARHTMGKV